MKSAPLLQHLVPRFASELAAQLEQLGEAALAEQVGALRVLDHERSGVAVYMYTAPRPGGPWGPTLRNVELGVRRGMVILDVVDGRIAGVEVLGRGDIRARLRELEE